MTENLENVVGAICFLMAILLILAVFGFDILERKRYSKYKLIQLENGAFHRIKDIELYRNCYFVKTYDNGELVAPIDKSVLYEGLELAICCNMCFDNDLSINENSFGEKENDENKE